MGQFCFLLCTWWPGARASKPIVTYSLTWSLFLWDIPIETLVLIRGYREVSISTTNLTAVCCSLLFGLGCVSIIAHQPFALRSYSPVRTAAAWYSSTYMYYFMHAGPSDNNDATRRTPRPQKAVRISSRKNAKARILHPARRNANYEYIRRE